MRFTAVGAEAPCARSLLFAVDIISNQNLLDGETLPAVVVTTLIRAPELWNCLQAFMTY